jgi:hypothetical protein
MSIELLDLNGSSLQRSENNGSTYSSTGTLRSAGAPNSSWPRGPMNIWLLRSQSIVWLELTAARTSVEGKRFSKYSPRDTEHTRRHRDSQN